MCMYWCVFVNMYVCKGDAKEEEQQDSDEEHVHMEEVDNGRSKRRRRRMQRYVVFLISRAAVEDRPQDYNLRS